MTEPEPDTDQIGMETSEASDQWPGVVALCTAMICFTIIAVVLLTR